MPHPAYQHRWVVTSTEQVTQFTWCHKCEKYEETTLCTRDESKFAEWRYLCPVCRVTQVLDQA
jgi:Zn finger protein HypA/HybF involved in hydrogenase expression